MLVPDFIDQWQEARKGRELVSLSELNVARDILEFKFVKTSGEDSDNSFFLSLTLWTETEMEVFVNFTDPTAVSKGENDDKIIMSFKNRYLFVSKESGLALGEDKINMASTFPKQMPLGVDADLIESQADAATNAMLGLVVV